MKKQISLVDLLALFIRISVISLFTLLSTVMASQNTTFDEEFRKAETTEQLELLLKKYPDKGENIIPKLESTIINEIKSKGVGNRFVIKEIMPQSEGSGSLTIMTAAATKERANRTYLGRGYVGAMEFPGDNIPFALFEVSIPFGNGSIHRFLGNVKLEDIFYLSKVTGKVDGAVVFIGEGDEGDKRNRLTFCVLKDVGYVYLRGKGKVITNGKETPLGY
jgi:hypothetical protein